MKTAKVVDFNANSLFFPQDKKIMKIFYGEDVVNNINQKNSRELLKSYFSNPLPDKNIENYFYNLLFSKMKKGDRLFVIADSAGIFEKNLDAALNPNSEKYENENLSGMIFARAEKDILELCNKYLTLKKVFLIKRHSTFYTRVQIYEKI